MVSVGGGEGRKESIQRGDYRRIKITFRRGLRSCKRGTENYQRRNMELKRIPNQHWINSKIERVKNSTANEAKPMAKQHKECMTMHDLEIRIMREQEKEDICKRKYAAEGGEICMWNVTCSKISYSSRNIYADCTSRSAWDFCLFIRPPGEGG